MCSPYGLRQNSAQLFFFCNSLDFEALDVQSKIVKKKTMNFDWHIPKSFELHIPRYLCKVWPF